MLSTENSNVSLAELDEFHALRLTPGWSTTGTAIREAAAVRATDFIAFSYSLLEGFDRTHSAVKRATCVLAALALTSTLTEAASAPVLSEEGTGIGKVEYGAAPGDPFPAVTAILSGVATRRGGGFQAARAVV